MTLILVDRAPASSLGLRPPRTHEAPTTETSKPRLQGQPLQAHASSPEASAPAATPAKAEALAAAIAPPRPGASSSRMAGTMRSHLGCDHARLLDLTKAEQAACESALGAGAKTAPLYAVISPKEKQIFDGVYCAETDEWCLYRMGRGPYPGLLSLMRKARE